jgi:AAA15 family ATPase/GTPase
MLLEFSIGNYLSFKDIKTLSLIASPISEFKENTFETDHHTLLKGAVIYGSNASGKSNFIKAMSTMRRLVLHSFNQSSAKPLNVTPFLLSTTTEKSPSHFEVIFQIVATRYRYGFEVDSNKIVKEWLFETKKSAEKPLFIREENGIDVALSFKEGTDLESKTRDNALFLAVVDQFNGPISKRIMKWFKQFIAISGLRHEDYQNVTFRMLGKENTAKPLVDFYKQLDLGFTSISIDKKLFDAKELPEDTPGPLLELLVKDLEGKYRTVIKSLHKKFDGNNKPVVDVEFDMRAQESSGTNKVFNISGPVFDVLHNGGVLVVDELDASLHPLMTLAISNLFNSASSNPNKAQLIFATHDSNLLSYGNYRRDQIYFIEKDQYGASDIYSLIEYREENGSKIRKDRSFEKDYIEGRYGAIPYIGDISKLASEWQEN